MALSQLQNYLVSYRKRTGLSQVEVAWILETPDNAAVSRYETGQRLPPLEVALGFEALFGVPVVALFAGTHARIARRIERRIALHHRRTVLKVASCKGRVHPMHRAKLQWHEARRASRV